MTTSDFSAAGDLDADATFTSSESTQGTVSSETELTAEPAPSLESSAEGEFTATGESDLSTDAGLGEAGFEAAGRGSGEADLAI